MNIIGLTGGIASGKSTVSSFFRQKGAAVLDADRIARELSEPGGKLHAEYVHHFGAEVLQSDGTLNRRRIGQIVFSDPQQKQWLDAVSHPAIRAELLRKLEQKRNEKQRLILLDIPLLFESGWDKMADKTCLVYVDESVQLQRLMKRDGYTRREAQDRIAAQMPLEEKKKRADYLIDNNGSLMDTVQQAEELWKEWIHGGLS
ncbi:dephospho-CoA kinase [Selenomonas montiformis]|uniref:Dephospho-CoA kinase n=1 Tax=Selenomonas montiformis TaxID=2652285 RepID=A0A6I2V1C9_9FIRM|nr:dephospho-CoA kinase [Selenomonas montiformis]MDY4697270.1 dephospho-CoA kinase [Selenomonas montiformis]MSV25376.1 dephospho-CoA kinase [Selenomonas montiformis]